MRKQFRSSVIVRNIYSEVLNIAQAIVIKKLKQKKIKSTNKKYLDDALMTSIAGISAAMKNTDKNDRIFSFCRRINKFFCHHVFYL